MNLIVSLANYFAKSLKNNHTDNWYYHPFGAEPNSEKLLHVFKHSIKDKLIRFSLFTGLFVNRYLDAYGKTIE
jgi:hypothetical protein